MEVVTTFDNKGFIVMKRFKFGNIFPRIFRVAYS